MRAARFPLRAIVAVTWTKRARVLSSRGQRPFWYYLADYTVLLECGHSWQTVDKVGQLRARCSFCPPRPRPR